MSESASFDILTHSLQGLRLSLANMYSSNERKIDVALCANRSFLRSLYMNQGAVNPPAIAYLVSGIAENVEGFNKTSTKNTGIRLSVDINGHEWLIARLTPVTVRVTVAFICNSYDDLMEFSSAWISNKSNLGFDLQYLARSKLGIKVSGNSDLNLPEMPVESDMGNLAVFETDLEMKTYIGKIQKIPGIIQIEGRAVFVPYHENINVVADIETLPDTVDLFTINLNNPNSEL